MRITERQLRQIIRETVNSTQAWEDFALLEKDADRIYQKVRDRASSGGATSIGQVTTGGEIDTSTAFGKLQKKLGRLPKITSDAQALTTTYSLRDADPYRVSNEKELKRIWAEEVEIEGSRSFFDKTLIKVHWIGGFKVSGPGPGSPFEIALRFIEKQPKGRNKDEISCFGYTPAQGINYKKTSVGVIIKGYTTYAFGVDAGTHMTSRATDVDRRKHSGSGLHKRPSGDTPTRASQYMIVDEESWNSSAALEHEVIVDNWVIGGIIVPSYQDMIDAMKSKLKGMGKERQTQVDQVVDEARKNFQELGRLAEETGIKFYDDRLQPIDFSGSDFEAGDLGSDWDKVLSGGDRGDKVVGGDPEAPEALVEGKTLTDLTFSSLSKPVIMRNCAVERLHFRELNGSKITLQDCEFVSFVAFESGQGSVEIRDPAGDMFRVSFHPSFTLRSATFVGCNFSNQSSIFKQDLAMQREAGAELKFENCEGVPDELLDITHTASPPPSPVQTQTGTSEPLFYHGPRSSGVIQLMPDEIAKLVADDRLGDHQVFINGEWKFALRSSEVLAAYNSQTQIPQQPQLTERWARLAGLVI